MISQVEIHKMASSKNDEDRKRSARALGTSFALLADKDQGWQDLQRLTKDQDSYVRRDAVRALGFTFAHLPDKDQGWQDLFRFTQDQDSGVRQFAARALGFAFVHLSDKDQAWKDLIRLTQDQDSSVRWGVARAIGSAFAHLPDKDQGWEDLHQLTQDQDGGVRWGAAEALGFAFDLLPNKIQGWQDLHQLSQDQDGGVRWGAAEALGFAFDLLPDKHQGWQDLHRLTQDQDSGVRRGAARAFGSAFVLLPDKDQGWRDLHQLTQDQDSGVRRGAARAIGSAFAHLPDKAQGWQDLHQLTQDQDSGVRRGTADSIGFAFALLPNKDQGWQDLHRLTQDQNSFVRWGAAQALGSAFAFLPDKTQGLQDLHQLSQDQESGVRMYAYHSLGRVSICRSVESNDKNIIKSRLEEAVEFFEKSSQEHYYSNPALFCCPFYRSYLALTFKGESEEEVKRYLAEAKEAIGSSENKKELFGVVENLAKALEETQKLKERSIMQIQSDLRVYQWYCDRAAEHLAAVEDEAPDAVKLLRKCNPIIEERIEAIIAGIQKTTREICQVTRGLGTKYEASGARINQEAKSLSSENPLEIFKASKGIASSLRELCRLLPKNKRGRGCEMADEIEDEPDLQGRLIKIDKALLYLQPNITLAAYESTTNNKLEEMHSDIKLMDKKINTIIFDLSKIKISSGDMISNLRAVKDELTRIAEMQKNFPADLSSISNSKQASAPKESQVELGNLIGAKVLELEEILKTKATKEDNQAILNKLESLKPSAGFEWLGRIADVISVFDASIKLLQFLA